MPRIIQTMCEVVPEEAVLVRSAYLRNNIKASALMAEARRRAKDLAVHAEAEAERICREARAEGYAAGVLQAAGELAQYLERQAEFASQLRSRLEQRLRALLHGCVINPEVLMATFEECLSQEDPGEARETHVGAGLELLLPESFRPNHRSLMARLQQRFHGRINIEYRQDSGFMLRVGDHVAEFAPEDFVARASARAMSSLPSVYAGSRAIADACRDRLAALFTPAPAAEDPYLQEEEPP
jgi:hypothetical protein